MTYISPKQRFIDDRTAEGCDREDVLFLADLEFDDSLRADCLCMTPFRRTA